MKARVEADQQDGLHGIKPVTEEAVTSRPVEHKDDLNVPLARIDNHY